ncbi:3-hydroxyacyl-CoA dehydrogenase family protein [Paenibacillus pabuli]|uniref:3-hydroxyacyl-CoA dehydrogenase family protein n=1 Tax=Paenibacillus pabuli TaxID=1472 RepID=UPI003CEA6710
MKLDKIGIAGAGLMGTDAALDFSSFGYKVILLDINADIFENSKRKMQSMFSLMKLTNQRYKSLNFDSIMNNIEFTTDNHDFSDVDLVVENITENWDKKKELYVTLNKVCRPDTIFAVNTSCISITKISGLMDDPTKVIGMHLMNPVPMKELVEVIEGFHTSEQTLTQICDFLRAVNKNPVVVKDLPGFVTNRVLMLTINECIWLVQDGVSNPADIDKIFRLGFGHQMGPLATCDLIGLDTILESLIVLFESYNDPKYRPSPLLRKMVDAGLLGKKSGKGFFAYE